MIVFMKGIYIFKNQNVFYFFIYDSYVVAYITTK